MRRILVGVGLALAVASPALADGGRCAVESTAARAAVKTLHVDEHQLPEFRKEAAWAPKLVVILARLMARDVHRIGVLDAQIAQTSLSLRKACDRPLGPGSERCLAKQTHLATLEALRAAQVSKLATETAAHDAAVIAVQTTHDALVAAESQVDADRIAAAEAAAAFRDCKATK